MKTTLPELSFGPQKVFNLLPKQSVPFSVGKGAALGNVAASYTRPKLTTPVTEAGAHGGDVTAAFRCCSADAVVGLEDVYPRKPVDLIEL